MFYIYVDGEELYYPTIDDLTLLDPVLTLETGKAGSLTFRIPPTNKQYSSLRKLKSKISVQLDEIEIFRGRVMTDNADFYNIKSIYCEGDLAYLVDSEQKSESYKGTVHDFFTKCIAAHNARVEPEKRFLVGDITVENRELIISGKTDEEETDEFDYRQIILNSITTEWKNTYDRITSCLIDNIGGYLRTRRVGDDVYIDYLERYNETTTQTLSFGVNILNLANQSSAEEVYSVLIPLGEDNLTIESVNGGSDELVDEAAVSEFGRIVRSHVFDEVTDPVTLMENGQRFLDSRANIPSEIDITAIDLHILNPDMAPILIGANIEVKSAPHSLSGELTCYKLVLYFENPDSSVYSFGTPRQTLTERYRKNKAKVADAIEDAVKSGGGRGGKKAAEDAYNRVYDEWISVNPDDPDGHISLGATYNTLTKMYNKLKTDLGLDFNAVDGTINLTSLRTGLDDAGKAISDNALRIDMVQKGTESQISILAGRTDHAMNTETSHYAELSLRANALESSIDLKADKTTISTEIDGVKSLVASFTKDLTTLNSKITAVRKLIADEIDALRGNVTWLSSVGISCLRLTAPIIGCENLVASNNIAIGSQYVATRDWVSSNFTKGDNVAWGSVDNGFVWLSVNGNNKRLAMANHTHSIVPRHRHHVSIKATIFGQTVTVSGYTDYSV